jgi:hypothetical protein
MLTARLLSIDHAMLGAESLMLIEKTLEKIGKYASMH